MSAYSIYDAAQRERPVSWQEYYVQLREALCDELLSSGRSELITELQSLQKGDSIQYLAAAVIYDCYYMLVLGRPQLDVTVYFPSWQGERQSWSVLERHPGEYCVKVQGALQERLEALAAVAMQMYDLRMETIAPTEEAAADAAVLREAERMRSEIARQQREIAALQEKNQSLSRDLMELENGYINDMVHMHMAQRRQEAEKAFEEELAERRREAEDAFRRHYAGEAEALQRQRDEAERQAAAALEVYRSGSRAVRSSISESLEGMKRAMEKQLNEWETALRSVDYHFLAQCYVSLNGAVRVDMAQTLADAADQGTPDEVMQSLHELETRLTGQLLRMEYMMTQLGLTVLRPAEGDAYDEQRHLRSGVLTYAMPRRPVVERLVLPGVMQGSDVLVRAEVTLTEKE